MANLFCVLGKSGSGKTTFLNEVLSNNIHQLKPIIYCTTRQKRTNEIDKKDYNFYTEEEYQELDPANIIESRSYNVFENGKEKVVRYFTLKSCIDTNINSIAAMSPYQYRDIRKYFENNKDFHIYVIYIYASNKNRVLRSLERINNDDAVLEVCRRMVDEQKEFNDVLRIYPEMYCDNDCLLINNDFSDIGNINSELQEFNEFINKINTLK